MCPKRLTTTRIRLQANLKVSYRENTNTWVTASVGDCTALTWLALRMKEQPTITGSTLQRLQKTTFRAHLRSLAMAGTFPLFADTLAVVSDVLNEGYLTGLQPRPPCTLHSHAIFPSSLPSSGVRCKWLRKDLMPFSSYHGEKTCNLCCSCLAQTRSEYIHTVWK